MVIIDFKYAIIEAWGNWLKVDICCMVSSLLKKLFFPFHLIFTPHLFIYF